MNDKTLRNSPTSPLSRRQFLSLAMGLAAAPLLAPSQAAGNASDFAKRDLSRLRLASVHAVVTDLSTGSRLVSKHADIPVSIASITKLMTAMVVLDAGQSLEEWLPFLERDRAAPANAYSRIRIHSEAPRREMMRMALTASENLAAHNLARHYPGGFNACIEAMNAKAVKLGMSQTHFVDPDGLSTGNVASASDVSRMVLAAHDYDPIRHLSTTAGYTVRFRQPRYRLRYGNTNALVHSPRWDLSLSKTGYLDDAGRCLVMVARFQGRPVAMVFLNAFGRRTPLGDGGRVRRWLETGESGPVNGAALAYERRQVAALESREKSPDRAREGEPADEGE
ncbi:MAG: D-alanyl-D-alanine endopeptidase [Oleiphilaceae bacterium]|nr:D-alanyl-D-alanine endopeptidase [Oleiphilaceae bacterium]